MNWFRRIVALVLLALWLPVTQHCGLEAAGLIGGVECSDDLPGKALPKDDCRKVETAHYKAAGTLDKVPPPALTIHACLACLQAANAARVEHALFVRRSLAERPRDWVSTWHFVRRTAPPSRAPSRLLA